MHLDNLIGLIIMIMITIKKLISNLFDDLLANDLFIKISKRLLYIVFPYTLDLYILKNLI
jgi:hypothetical protein